MAKQRGRVKGETSKNILIKDELIAPYVISVDGSNTFIVHKEDDNSSQLYYASLPLALKAIVKRKCIPHNAQTTYTINEYVKGMMELNKQLAALLDPQWHQIN